MTSRFDMESTIVALVVALAIGMALGVLHSAIESRERIMVECVRHHTPKECGEP